VKLLEDKTIDKVNQLNDNLYFSYELDKPFMELAKEVKEEIEHLEHIEYICFDCDVMANVDEYNGFNKPFPHSPATKCETVASFGYLELIKELIGEELANTIY
tara:strand:+ start:516 stop:824 length:309 start_codon:yes stop_codon:yes gene_type:complete